MAVPEMTADERRAALDKAMRLRKERGLFLERMREGEVGFAQALELARADSECIGGIRVKSVIETQPCIGPVKRQAIMRRIGISESKRLRGLSHRQEMRLLDELG